MQILLSQRRAIPVFCCTFAVFASLLGCGTQSGQPNLGQVVGAVLDAGKPIAGMTVMFTPDGGRPASGTTDAQGKFSLTYLQNVKGCRIGTHTVTFEQPVILHGNTPPPPTSSRAWPDKVDVKAGYNTFDFDLSKMTSKQPESSRRR